MILIIAEKPSLGRNIAAGIGSFTRRDGYLENSEYIITWAFGHLFSLADIEAYTGSATRKWTMQGLPCFPSEFKFELRRDKSKNVDSGVEKQFKIIKSLCLREDVTTIVNAGDADREGEIIVRLCIINSGCRGKEFKRLWLPDQTPETVAAALKSMKSELEYENLANEGFARTYIDWLYGVNLTRYASIRTGEFLRVGRIIVPIVRAIYERDKEIANFVPTKYYTIGSFEETNGAVVELVSEKKFAQSEYNLAEETSALYNAADAVVTKVKKKKEKLFPGKLYSLSKLQSFLGKKYKMSMADSLAILQKLYEQGYVSYPRTNSEYLATAEQGKIKTIIEKCKSLGYPVEFKFSKTIFDDSKIEAHSAITPTYKIPKKSDLSETEYLVYAAVFRRFVAVFCSEDCLVERTEIHIKVGDYETFVLKGVTMLEPGWTKYDDYSGKDKILPPLSEGDLVNHIFKPIEKETSPPKHYTIETLNNYLKNPFREEKAAADDADDSEEYKAIFQGLELGTEATRSGIIDNARNSGYILLKGNVYTILPDGEFLVESLDRMNIKMDKYTTSEMGRALKKVSRGEMTVSESVALAECEIAEIFKGGRAITESLRKKRDVGKKLGTCPLCGGTVVVTDRGFACTEPSCTLRLFSKICMREISDSELTAMLEKGKTELLDGFRGQSGAVFSAYLKLEDGKYSFEFPEKKSATSTDKKKKSTSGEKKSGQSARKKASGAKKKEQAENPQ